MSEMERKKGEREEGREEKEKREREVRNVSMFCSTADQTFTVFNLFTRPAFQTTNQPPIGSCFFLFLLFV